MNEANPPRVMMVISNFHPTRGGAENQALALSRELTRRGAKVSVLTLMPKGMNVERDETFEGIRILRYLSPLPLGPLWGWTYGNQVGAALRQFQSEYDIIHCHQVYIHAAVAVRVGRDLKKPVVCKVVCGGDWSDFLRLKQIRGGGAYLYDALEVDRMVALNQDIKREVLAQGVPDERIAVIPNMVDTEQFSPGEAPRNEGELVFIGRLHEQKNVLMLIEAFVHLVKSKPQAQLRLVGDGPERKRYEIFARNRGVGDRVHFEGFREDVRPWLRRAGLVVSASKAEGMSNVLLEAMACGAPIVASNAQGNAELLEAGEADERGFYIGKSGMVVTGNGPEAFARALDFAIENPETMKSLGDNARTIVVERYSIDHVVDRYVNLYRELMKK